MKGKHPTGLNQIESAEQINQALDLLKVMNRQKITGTIELRNLDLLTVQEVSHLVMTKLHKANPPSKNYVHFEFEPWEGVDLKLIVKSKPLNRTALEAVRHLN